ncbi:MAG: hypothetical protein U0Q18_20295 [Bryobacteraceae bacterium]
MMTDRLESELAGALGSVHAPEMLWDRVELALEKSGRPESRHRWLLAAAAIALAAAGALVYHSLARRFGADFDSLALRVHREWILHPDQLSVRLSDAARLRGWITANTPVSLAMRRRGTAHPGSIEIAGARVVRYRGAQLAAIAYRVDAHPATLLIGRESDFRVAEVPRTDRPQHHALPADGVDVYRWQSHGQLYALVAEAPEPPEPGRRACQLCHAST